jgi:hypothetical protein
MKNSEAISSGRTNVDRGRHVIGCILVLGKDLVREIG